MRAIIFFAVTILIHKLSSYRLSIDVVFNNNDLNDQLIRRYSDICAHATNDASSVLIMNQLREMADKLKLVKNNVFYKDFIAKDGYESTKKINEAHKKLDQLNKAYKTYEKETKYANFIFEEEQQEYVKLGDFITHIHKIYEQNTKKTLEKDSDKIESFLYDLKNNPKHKAYQDWDVYKKVLNTLEDKIVNQSYKEKMEKIEVIILQLLESTEKSKERLKSLKLKRDQLYREMVNIYKNREAIHNQFRVFKEKWGCNNKKSDGSLNIPIRSLNISNLSPRLGISIVDEKPSNNHAPWNTDIKIKSVTFEDIELNRPYEQLPDRYSFAYLFSLKDAQGKPIIGNVGLGTREMEIPKFGDIIIMITDLDANGLRFKSRIYTETPSEVIAAYFNNYEWVCDLSFRNIWEVILECSVSLKSNQII